jgi:hypothetical protein
MEVADESRVQLPPGAVGPIEVFVNGVLQREAADFDRRDGELVFRRRLAREGRLGFWRWLSIFLGVAGTYRQNDSVDIVYEVNGKKTVESGLPILDSEPITTEER